MAGIGSRSGPGVSVDFDPKTRDFRGTSDGYWSSTHWVDQAVTLALTIERGKLRSVPDQGVRYRQIKRLGPSVQAEVEDMTREALSRLLASPAKIAIVSIETQQPIRGQLLVAVTYRNLITGAHRTARNYEQKSAGQAPTLAPGPYTASEIADMVANSGLKALWDTAVVSSVALNGANVSGVTDQTGLGNDITQATPANQPLRTGSPTYVNWPSIAFSKASTHRLFKSSVDLIGTGPSTVILVGNLRTTGGRVFDQSTNDSQGEVLQYAGGIIDFTAWGVSGRAGPAWPIAAACVIIGRDTPGVTATIDLNGVKTTTGAPTATRVAPGAGGLISIGAGATASVPADLDFLFGAVFSANISDVLANSISARLKSRLGLP